MLKKLIHFITDFNSFLIHWMTHSHSYDLFGLVVSKSSGIPFSDMEFLRVPNPKPARYPYSRWRFHRFTHLLGEQNIDPKKCHWSKKSVGFGVLSLHFIFYWILYNPSNRSSLLQSLPSEYPGIEANKRSRLGWRSRMVAKGKCNGWHLESKTIWDQSRYTKKHRLFII